MKTTLTPKRIANKISERFLGDQDILREQLVYVRKTDPISLVGIILAAITVSYIIYFETNTTSILYWLAIVTLVTVIWGAIQFKHPSLRGSALRFEAKARTLMGIIYSVIWGWMIITHIPSATPLMMVTLTMVTGVVVAGSVTTQSPFIPLCVLFVTPTVGTVVYALLTRSEAIDYILATGATMYFLALVLCMVTIEKTVRNSIELNFENQKLINKLQSSMKMTIEATEAKTRFLASASHDLRQPIQALSLVAEAFKYTNPSTEQNELLKHLQSAVDSTRNLVDSLLDFSKVESGAIVPVIAPFSVEAMFKRLHSELAPLAKDKGLELRHHPTAVAADSDVKLVEMILRNLIGNAIRYTHDGGVLMSCRKLTNGALSIEVWDTGIGLSEEDKQKVFKEFQQVGEPDRNQQEGFGLGLAISQGLAHTLGSEITLDSREGKGSVFRFQIPKSDATIIEEVRSRVSSEAVDFTGKSVLVIDDSERIRASMLALLRSWGCRCAAAETIPQALSKIAHFQPDLLLVDYRLQDGAKGTNAINNIRTFTGKDLPAVIITGDNASNRFNEIEGSQPAMMRKPVSASELKIMIASILSAKGDNDIALH